MGDHDELPDLVAESDAIIGAFFAYAADHHDCGIIVYPSTSKRHRCTCGLTEWTRRAVALRALLRQ